MYYEFKIKREIEQSDGKLKKDKRSILVEGASVKNAINILGVKMRDNNIDIDSDITIVSVTESRIKEEANPMYFVQNEGVQGWTVYLEQIYIDLDRCKEKKLRYPVLVWDTDVPNKDSGELEKYLNQVDPAGNCFSVVKISKSPVMVVL